MLGKVLLVSISLANILIMNVTGKSSWKLIETEDEPDTQGGAIAEAQPCISKEYFVLDYLEPEIVIDSGEAPPVTENTNVTPSLPEETETIDWSKYNPEWVRKKDLLKKICRGKLTKKEKHKKMCRKWKSVVW